MLNTEHIGAAWRERRPSSRRACKRPILTLCVPIALEANGSPSFIAQHIAQVRLRNDARWEWTVWFNKTFFVQSERTTQGCYVMQGVRDTCDDAIARANELCALRTVPTLDLLSTNKSA